MQTRWFVITGAPCAGKTTIINELSRRGHACTQEASRFFIDSQLAKGISLSQMRSNEGAFQKSLISAKLDLEETLDPLQFLFMDRAMPDSISYLRMKGIDHREVYELSKKFRYAGVFLIERLPFERDEVRIEDEKSRAYLEAQLELDYQSLGYEVLRIPAMPLLDRVARVLELAVASVLF